MSGRRSGSLLSRSPAGKSERVEHFGSVTSTNTVALECARSGDQCPQWFVADEQTAGRGRHGRHWLSPTGNLHATRLIVTSQPMARMTGLAFVAAVALHDAVASVVDARTRRALLLKWPNDLLAHGVKLAGILIEAETMGERVSLAIGMGVNVCNAPQDGATSLVGLGCDAAASDLFEALDPAFERWFATWSAGHGFPAIRAAWLHRGPTIGTPAGVRSHTETLSGKFAGLDEDGALLLELAGGQMRRITAGEVLGIEEGT